MLISRNLHKKSSEVSIKTGSPPASFSFKGQGTKHTTIKWSILNNHCLPSVLQFSGYKQYSEGRNCSVWVYVKIEGYKKNTYTMYLSGINFDQPVHYEMMGYDTLFGSHYDQYEMDYMNYSDEMPPSSVFDIMEGLFVELYVQNVCI